MTSIVIHPIGVIRTPFSDKASAPRQTSEAPDVEGTVELFEGQGFEDALEGLETFDRIWLLFHFSEADGWRPKVQPPRSAVKRGLFATRSPHRPSGIGMSAVRLARIEGLSLHVVGVDMVDGTPLLDIKPYIPYCDAFPEASSGWLASPTDPGPRWDVTWSPRAEEQIAWLRAQGFDLKERVETLLSTGPEPHAYRRIRRKPDGSSTLAVQSWRLGFTVVERTVVVQGVSSGYRRAELAAHRPDEPAELPMHRAFSEAFDP